MYYIEIIERCLSLTKQPKRKLKTLLPICKCAHGEIHHNGKFAECTCPIEIKQYSYSPCNCANYKIDLNDSRNKMIMEWNNSV